MKTASRLGKEGRALHPRDRPRDADLGRLVLPRRLRGGEAALEDEPPAARADDDREPEPRPPAPRAPDGHLAASSSSPGSSKLNPKQFEADLLAFAQQARGGRAAPARSRARAPSRRKPTARRPASGGPAPRGPPPTADELSAAVPATLQRRLDRAAAAHGDANQISLLVMKVAREFFERGVLFLVKHDELRGPGRLRPRSQGPEPQPPGPRDRDPPRRALGLPGRGASRPSPSRPAARGQVDAAYLMGKVGPLPVERGGAAAPRHPPGDHRRALRRQPRDRARRSGRLDTLEVFMNQAGVAFENAFLQRKIQSLQG